MIKKYVLPTKSQLPFRSKAKNIVWRIVNSLIFPITFRMNWVRVFLIKIFGAKIGKNSRISSDCRIDHPGNLIIGVNSSVGNNVYLQCLDKIFIGDNVCISEGVSILTGTHDINSDKFDLKTKPIYIRDKVWVAFNAIILPGVDLGVGCVVGAGSVVVKSVEDFAVVSGNPAKNISKRLIDSLE